MGAVSYIGASNLIATNGGAPGAITPHASTTTGDLLIFYHYGRATGANETVTPPGGTGWTQIFNSVTANNGHVAAFYRIRQSGDTTYTWTVANYTSGTSGETILQWIETFRGHNASVPIASFTASLSTWTSSVTLGSIAAPSVTSVITGAMAVVFAGRFENVTAQTTLTGDGLTWSPSTRNDSTLGLDAGAVTQRGYNGTTSTQTLTAKSITTTGTAAAGAGRMFIINPASVNTTLDVTNGSITFTGASVTLSKNTTLNITAGSINFTGNVVDLSKNTTLNVTPGNITLTGQSIDLLSSALPSRRRQIFTLG